MKKYTGPYPTTDFARQVARVNMPPFRDTISGEVNSDSARVLGVANIKGKIIDVIASVATCGKNDASVPTGTFNVYINGTSCLSTAAVIAHVSGEAAQFKTTWSEAADTGITEAVINNAANDVSIGDIISWRFSYTGNTSPTTKMACPSIIVEIDPVPPV